MNDIIENFSNQNVKILNFTHYDIEDVYKGLKKARINYIIMELIKENIKIIENNKILKLVIFFG